MSADGTPCWETGIDPDDWFISKDGKQYPSNRFLTEAEERAITRAVLPISGETDEQHQDRVDKALRVAIADRRRAALVRRRKAKEACFECPVKQQCLALALEQGIHQGTWGGFYEEELDDIRREQRKRAKRSQSGGANGPQEQQGEAG